MFEGIKLVVIYPKQFEIGTDIKIGGVRREDKGNHQQKFAISKQSAGYFTQTANFSIITNINLGWRWSSHKVIEMKKVIYDGDRDSLAKWHNSLLNDQNQN